uniref:Uncharacterized protein n=1 Tax=Oryza meridionalis TaxID=40149 RepID=A0A0E0CDB7_9ORYZ
MGINVGPWQEEGFGWVLLSIESAGKNQNPRSPLPLVADDRAPRLQSHPRRTVATRSKRISVPTQPSYQLGFEPCKDWFICFGSTKLSSFFLHSRFCNRDMASHSDSYMQALRQAVATPNCVVVVVDHGTSNKDLDHGAGQKDKDSEAGKMLLHEGAYQIGPISSNCIIKKNVVDFECYSVLKSLRHPAIVAVNNFYLEDCWNGRLVLGEVKFSFRRWLSTEGQSKIFKDQKTLLTIEVLTAGAMEKKEDLWRNVRKIFQDVCNAPSKPFINISADTARFLRFIGVSSTEKLAGYPDTWTCSKKSCYLLTIIACKSDEMRANLPYMDLDWPRVNSRTNATVPVLRDLIHYYQTRPKNPIIFKRHLAFDYFKLCRHVLKHWEKLCRDCQTLQDYCKTSHEFLDMMEKWDPEVWCKLYEVFDWPDDTDVV